MKCSRILFIGILCLLPIWRVAKVEGGLNLLEYLSIMVSKDKPYEHISYDEAVRLAREAYVSSTKV